ncbi:DUF2066 domain-containing protein [Kordiimonas laminariae]|uniref:DUF2066 domain-containing protein n=1 Tax=Kordiimonas laminariae TaxID=2917717 RepID=UPI001FF49F69|nr:DUF2066 domain-containing protein [Kordiimonas laminariae]MCK0069900.1 DUF2066 domain-containing protein [Kordiimonas laminariae]
MKVLFRISAVMTLCFVSVLSFGHSSLAQTTESLDRLFTIKAIKVDETARRASEAQRTALAKAELEAFDKLLLKVTQPEGRAILPEITTAEKQSLISGLEIVEESSSSRRYTATLNVRFEPSLVSQFLARYHVPHVLSVGRGLVVFYAFEDGLNEYLWQRNTSSDAAIDQVDWINRIRNYTFPVGGLRERALVSYEEVKELDLSKRDRLLAFYNLPSVLFIHSTWNVQSSSLSYKFKLSDDNLVGDGYIEAATSIEAQETMFEEVLEQIDSVWRSQLLVDTGQGGSMDVLLETTSLESLVEVEKKLADVTLVQNVKIDEVGLPFSRISFLYTGREDQLVVALRFAGLNLEEYGEERLLKARN